MTARTKACILLLALAVAVLIGSFVGATQYTAERLSYDRRLGPPALAIAGARVYAPWAWIGWSERFERYIPNVFAVAQAINYGGALAALALFLVAVSGLKRAPDSTTHGSARWGRKKDLRRAGLLEPSGVVLCQTSDARYKSKPAGAAGLRWSMRRPGRLVRHDGPEHVFVFAPTRSGKGIGIVIPTLLSWSRSVIVYDIKKELWAATAGWRRRFSHCWRFEPTAMDSVHFNPLFEIRRGLSEVKDAQNVADILVDPRGGSEKRDHWQQTAHTLLVGAILHVLYAERDKSLAGVAAFLADPLRPQDAILERMLNTRHKAEGTHAVVAQTAREMLNKSENELSGVFSTAMTCLALYADPVIARNTSRSDFRIADLMNLDSPASLYLVVPPSDIDRTRPLIRLMLNQIGRRLTEHLEFKGTAYRHKLLMLLDEFPSLGRLTFFEGELPYLAGYGIKCFLIAQSLNQIEKAYGANNAILDNCHLRVTYNALDERTAERISDLLGQATIRKGEGNAFTGASSLFKRSRAGDELGRPLMMPDEILRLPYDEALLMVGGLPPYHAKKIMYYLDPRFRDRAWLKPPDSPRAQLAELPPRPHAVDWPEPPDMPPPEELPVPLEEGPAPPQPTGPSPAAPAGTGSGKTPRAPKSPVVFNKEWAQRFDQPGPEEETTASDKAEVADPRAEASTTKAPNTPVEVEK